MAVASPESHPVAAPLEAPPAFQQHPPLARGAGRAGGRAGRGGICRTGGVGVGEWGVGNGDLPSSVALLAQEFLGHLLQILLRISVSSPSANEL